MSLTKNKNNINQGRLKPSDMTMADKLYYITTDDTQNYSFCIIDILNKDDNNLLLVGRQF